MPTEPQASLPSIEKVPIMVLLCDVWCRCAGILNTDHCMHGSRVLWYSSGGTQILTKT